ncbi:hypothetical protein Dimus_014909 [Dionaea muscipula]
MAALSSSAAGMRTCILAKTHINPTGIHHLPMLSPGFKMNRLVVEAKARKRVSTRTESAKVRDRRWRKKYNGTSSKPRLSVFCSDKQLYAMLVDDENKKCLFYGSTLQKSIRDDPSMTTVVTPSFLVSYRNIVCPVFMKLRIQSLQEAAKLVGEELVKAAINLNINEISSYDRNGFACGERMKAFEIAISGHGFLLH